MKLKEDVTQLLVTHTYMLLNSENPAAVVSSKSIDNFKS